MGGVPEIQQVRADVVPVVLVKNPLTDCLPRVSGEHPMVVEVQ